MTDDERRQARIDGETGRDIRLCGSGGMSIEYYRERRRGEVAAGLTDASESHYVYGDEGASFFYEDAS